jgi:hypothetical protein
VVCDQLYYDKIEGGWTGTGNRFAAEEREPPRVLLCDLIQRSMATEIDEAGLAAV